MKTYADMTKEEIIAAEKRKLSGIYSKLETKTKKSVSSLIDNAAFMAASLWELQRDINTEGYTEEYHNRVYIQFDSLHRNPIFSHQKGTD